MENTELRDSIDTLRKYLIEDEGYYIGWKANIAIQFIDEHDRVLEIDNKGKPPTREQICKIADRAAQNFLNLLVSGH